MILSYYHTILLSYYHTIKLYNHTIILSNSHTIIISLNHTIMLSYYHTIKQLSYQTIIIINNQNNFPIPLTALPMLQNSSYSTLRSCQSSPHQGSYIGNVHLLRQQKSAKITHPTTSVCKRQKVENHHPTSGRMCMQVSTFFLIGHQQTGKNIFKSYTPHTPPPDNQKSGGTLGMLDKMHPVLKILLGLLKVWLKVTQNQKIKRKSRLLH